MLTIVFRTLLAAFRTRQSLVLDNLALRHQVQVLKRGGKRPKIKQRDRALWVLLSRFWPGWRTPLLMVKPETVIRWHRAGFRTYWRLKSQRRHGGRPRLTLEERKIIRQMARENPLWGAPRIHGELAKIGFLVSQATVSKYMKQVQPPPTQSWTTFLKNHARDMISIDYFTVPTAFMKTLYVLLILSNDRRKILRYEVTDIPAGAWAAERVIEALDFEGAPRLLLRDRDQKFGVEFNARITRAGIRQRLSAHRCPWQNGYVERAIGSIHRECLDHVIIFNKRHLRRVLAEYFDYYNRWRTHLGLEKDCPEPRAVEPPVAGPIQSVDVLGGLHHRYYRRAA